MIESLLALILFLSPATIDHGRCSKCKALGVSSSVYIYGTSCSTTALYCGGGSYSEAGRYSPAKPCNTTTCTSRGRCSRGHEIVDEDSGGLR